MTDLEKMALEAVMHSYEGKAFAEAYVRKPEIKKAVQGVLDVLRENGLSAAESIGLMEFMKLPILSDAKHCPKC